MSALEKETALGARVTAGAAHRLDQGRSRGAVRAAVQRSPVLGAMGASAEFRSERRAGLDVAVDQDGRVPRGLRVLPAEHPLRDGHRSPRSDAARRGPRGGAAARRTPAPRGSAWARRTAGPRIRSSSRSSRWSKRSRRWGSRPARRLGLLRPGPGRTPRRSGPRLLQPQPRLVGRVLREDHQHAHLCATGSRRSSACARPA